MNQILSYISPPRRSNASDDPIVLTDAQRAAVRALYAPSVIMLGGSALLMLAVLLGYVDSTLSTFRTYGENVMFNSLCLGIVLCYFTLPPRRDERVWAVPAMVLGEAIRFAWHPTWWSVTMRLQTFGYIAGLVALLVIAWRTFRAVGDEALWARAMLLLSLIMFFFPNVSFMLHTIVVHHTPVLYDAYGFVVDGAFGFQPAAEATIFVDASTLMWITAFLVYNELPLFMIIAVLLSLRWPRACYGQLMLHMTIIGLVGFICYTLVPMKGIDLFLGAEVWPFGPFPPVPSPAPYGDLTGATRNCYPSLHMGWMLAVWLGVRRVHPWVSRLFGFCTAVMVLATLHIGHYAVDLVASVPYVVGFFGLINVRRAGNGPARIAAAVGGFTLFAAFTVALLRAPVTLATHPAGLAALAAGVVGLAVLLEQWLARTTLGSADVDESVRIEATPLATEEPVPV